MPRGNRESVASQVRRALAAVADPGKARTLAGFFKTGPGEYGEGDLFIGVTVPPLRRIAREFSGNVSFADIAELLASPVHEERLAALLLLVAVYERAPAAGTVRFYLRHRRRINNWDLVDLSAPTILGDWLLTRSRSRLDVLARSSSVWDRRIAIVSTLTLIRAGEFADTFRLADLLLQDRHDLIHKAAGWMLREAGKRDQTALEDFLKPRSRAMPRTMLRYAIERFPEPLRRRYLHGTPPA